MNPLRHLRNRKVIAVLAFVALLLVMALWPAAVPVDLAAVERGPLLVTVEGRPAPRGFPGGLYRLHLGEPVPCELGVTRERVRQIEKKAIGKLRHYKRRSRLKGYIDLP